MAEGAGSEFALAVVRFVGDTTQLDRSYKTVATSATAAATNIGSAFSSKALAASTFAKAHKQEIDNLVKEYGRVGPAADLAGAGVTKSGNAFKSGVPHQQSFNNEMRHASRLFRETGGAIFSQFAPGLTSAIGGVGGLSRSMKGMGGAMMAGMIAFQLISKAIKYFGDQAEKATQTQLTLRKAKDELNISLASGIVDQAMDDLRLYDQQAKNAANSLNGFEDAAIGGLSALLSMSGEVKSTGTAWSGLRDLVGGVFGYWKNKLEDAFGEDKIDKIFQARQAFIKLWREVELPKQLAENTKARLAEIGTALEREFGEAVTNRDRAAISELVRFNIKKSGELAEQQIRDADKTKIAKIDATIAAQRVVLLSLDKESDAYGKTAQTILTFEEEKNGILRVQDGKISNERQANRAKDTEAALRSNNAQLAYSKQQIDFALAGAAIQRTADEQIANDAGKLYTGLEAFQNLRRSSIQETARLDIQAAEQSRDVRLAAIQEEINAARAANDTEGTTAALEKKNREQIRYTESVKKLSEETTQKLAADANTVYQENRASINARLALEDQAASYRRGLGQQTIADDLAVQQSRASNYELTAKQRQDAEVAAQNIIRKAEQDTFDLATAQGKKTQTDAVNFAGQLASSWKEGTQQRLDAEKKFASEVTALWDALKSAGRSLRDMAMEELAAMGNLAPTMGEVNQKIDEMKIRATQLNEQWMAGGRLTKEQADLIDKVSDANVNLKKTGQDALTAIKTSALDAARGLGSAQTTTEDMTGGLRTLGVVVGSTAVRYADMNAKIRAGEQITQLATDGMENFVLTNKDVQRSLLESARAQIAADQAWADVAAAERQVSLGAAEVAVATDKSDDKLAKVVSNFKGAYGQIEGATDDFYEALSGKIDAGNSRIADTVYQYFTREVIRKLDAEAARS